MRLKGDTSWKDQFFCVRNLALAGDTLVLPAGGLVVWLQDTGKRPVARATYHSRREAPATLGLSIDAEGAVYRQWTRRDNNGSIEVLRPFADEVKFETVGGTETSYQGAGSLSFSSVSIRGKEVYRCRPEEGFGLCRHSTDADRSPPNGMPGRIPGHQFAHPLGRQGRLRWTRRQPLRGPALGRCRRPELQDGLRTSHHRPRGGRRRTRLFWLRGWISLRPGTQRKRGASYQEPAIGENPQPLDRPHVRSQIRLGHLLRRRGQHQRRQTRAKTPLETKMGPPL